LHDALTLWHSADIPRTRPIVPNKIEHSPTSLVNHSGAADEVWYEEYHANWTLYDICQIFQTYLTQSKLIILLDYIKLDFMVYII
jgi:hypothetical protein